MTGAIVSQARSAHARLLCVSLRDLVSHYIVHVGFELSVSSLESQVLGYKCAPSCQFFFQL